MLNNNLKYIIAVPARISSKRLKRKVLEKIAGITILEYVLKQCEKCKYYDEIIVFTDDDEIKNLSQKIGHKAIMTSPSHKSGSERIASNISKIKTIREINSTYIVNVQADQPLINPEIIDNLMEKGSLNSNKESVYTCVYKLGLDKVNDPNIVKVVLNKKNEALYFSRSVIPHLRDEENYKKFNDIYLGHVGVYGYRGNILLDWNKLPQSKLEDIESLEQLRLLDSGIKIKALLIKNAPISIDTLEQLFEVKRIIEGNLID